MYVYMSIPFLLYYCINMHAYIETKLIIIQAEYYYFLLFIWGCLVYFFKWWLVVKTSFYPRFNSKFYQTEILPPPPKKKNKRKEKTKLHCIQNLEIDKIKRLIRITLSNNNQTNEHAFVINDFIYSIVDSLCDWKKE